MEQQSLEQINFAYHPLQDRILFRMGAGATQEVQLWITYRIARLLFAILNSDAHLPTASAEHVPSSPSQALAQFAKEAEALETLKGMDFTATYEQARTPMIDSELIVAEVDVEHAEQANTGNPSLKSLHLKCSNGVCVNLNLSQELILAMANSLQIVSREAQWLLNEVYQPETTEPLATISGSVKQVLH